MIIDTHAHLYLGEFDEDRDEMMERAFAVGIEQFYLPNIDSSSVERMLKMEAAYPGQCYPMMGLHPCSVGENYREELAIAERWLAERPFNAIGEVGIDLYWDTTYLQFQKIAFRTQIGWAKELSLPIVIHSRNSLDLIIDLLKQEKDDRLQGIFHCFTGSLQQAEEIMDLGFYMGIGGVLSFKNSGLAQTVAEIPIDRLVLETDAPYLAPTPHRGKRNESAYLKLIAEKLALVKNMPFEEVAAKTTENAKKIFEKKTGAYATLY